MKIPLQRCTTTIASLCLFALCMSPTQSNSCTSIFWNDNGIARVVARSMDLYTSDLPIIMTTPRGTKQSGEAGENSLSWQSKYGSVSVTAFHSDAVSDGLNEKGLAVHLLYLSETTYPTHQTTAKISNVLWGQYILDNFSTVDEALKGVSNLNIIATKIQDRTWPVHLAIEDATGDSAIIEYIQGKMQVYHGPQYQVMTNEPAYHIQLSNLKRYQAFGGTLSLPGDTDPLSRFVRVATYLKTLPKPKDKLQTIAGILSVMRTAMVPFGAEDTSGNQTVDAWATRWVSVADVTNKVYYYQSTSAPNIIWIDLNNINFNVGAPRAMIDPNNIHLVGEVTKQLSPKPVN